MKNIFTAKNPLVLGFFLSLISLQVFASEVNVYSARKEALIKPLLDEFSKQTGIEVNLVTAKANALVQRIQAEGANSPADVLITVDAGRLVRAKELGLLQKLDTSSIKLDAKFIDSDNHWVALSKRARVIFYNPKTISPNQLSTYQALANPEFKGKICIRSSSNIYNQSLVASMIHNLGEQKTGQFIEKFVTNFARDPKGGDRDQIKAVATGFCDIAIANTYYYGGMLNDKKDSSQYQAAQKVALFWPNQQTSGAHINISGAGIVKNAPNSHNAQKLIEFLLTKDSQKFYAEVNFEMPVLQGVAAHPSVKKWGNFKEDAMKLVILGENNRKAVILMDKNNWK